MKRRWHSILCIFVLVLALLPVSARADMGPKPNITIHVENAPVEPCYLDLLIPDEASDNRFDNLDWNHISASLLDSKILSSMRSVQQSGWHYAMLDGTQTPLNGEIQSPTADFSFSYHGTPDTFRIVLATEDGAQLSPVQHRTRLWQEFTLDYRTGAVTTGSPFVSYVRQFLSSLLPTLLIEGVLLLPFGFWDKRNLAPFFGVNIGTQILLTVVTAWCMANDMIFYRYIVFLPLELVIWLIEALLYRKLLHSTRKNPHPILYALCANGLSMIATFFSVRWVFPWI